MTAPGFGARAAVLVWVALTVAVMAALTFLLFWWEVLHEPSGVGSDATADPGLVETALTAPVLGAWMTGLAQIVVLPLAAVVGVGATGWAAHRRRASRRPRRRSVGRARPPRGGSR